LTLIVVKDGFEALKTRNACEVLSRRWHMHFKLEFGIHRLLLVMSTSLEFSYRGPHALSVHLWTPVADEHGKWYEQGDAYGTATSEREPNPNVSEMFERLAAGKRPTGSAIDPKSVGWVHDEQGHIFPDDTAPAHVLPMPFQSFIRDAQESYGTTRAGRFL
jgi:hypothetical protein